MTNQPRHTELQEKIEKIIKISGQDGIWKYEITKRIIKGLPSAQMFTNMTSKCSHVDYYIKKLSKEKKIKIKTDTTVKPNRKMIYWIG